MAAPTYHELHILLQPLFENNARRRARPLSGALASLTVIRVSFICATMPERLRETAC
ncbi:MAG: hypothetical protein RMJ43_09715 [Chloroherpetonaceae bacterium]|nr:hypothetical protein [Chthonomonadaceae bacterium]MDW8208102.1 hypothetical protein [Chloroherpetonaceae bacterium]